MKKSLMIRSLFVMVLFFALAVPSVGGERATADECVAKCKEAVRLIGEAGLENAIATMNDKKGPFVWKDSYVACIDMESGKLLAHAYLPTAIGGDFKYLSDAKGKLYIEEMLDLAEKKGEGWVSYMYPRPGDDAQVLPKRSYVLRVPGEKVVVLAGYYE